MAYKSQSVESLPRSSVSVGNSGDAISLLESQTLSPESGVSSRHKSAIKLAVSLTSCQGPGTQTSFISQSPRHKGQSIKFSHIQNEQDEGTENRDYGIMSVQVKEDELVPRRPTHVREYVRRPISQDSGLRLPGGTNIRSKYSFGLYFPPPSSANQSKVANADNHSSPNPMHLKHGTLQDTDSSNIGSQLDSMGFPAGRDKDGNNKCNHQTSLPPSHSLSAMAGLHDKNKSSRGIRCFVPVLSQSSCGSDNGNYSGDGKAQMRRDRAPLTVSSTSQPSTERMHYNSLNNVSSVGHRTKESFGSDSPTRTTFVVRIPVSGSASTSQNSYGSSFAVTRSPRHTLIDIQRQSPSLGTNLAVQRQSPLTEIHFVEAQTGTMGTSDRLDRGHTVWQRKVLFENGKNENNLAGKPVNRYRTELEKLTTQRKFTSIATRMASFEKSSDEDNEEIEISNNTQPSNVQTHSEKHPKEQLVSSEDFSASDNDIPPVNTDSEQKKETECSIKETQNLHNPSPDRNFVSSNNRSFRQSPAATGIVSAYKEDQHSGLSSQCQQQTVQIVQPLVQDSSIPQQFSHFHLSAHHEKPLVDTPWQDSKYQSVHQMTNLPPSSRPARKSSYLSAVNAPTTHYSLSMEKDHIDGFIQESSSNQHLSPISVMSSSDSAITFNHLKMPHASPTVSFSPGSMETIILRKKSASAVEDSTAKLHRRTSYLMATARDRSNSANTLEASASPSPYSLSIPEESATLSQTPSIVEATECKGKPPESPLAEITREGPLWSKIAMYDGKKCSDRSWKQVWAILRGHALFLLKDHRENSALSFNFEEPPISIKSCLVDIAHDYSRKRKYVFRLTTFTDSVYLLQAVDKGTMMSWIQAIKTNNNPDNDEEGVGNAELIRRKVSTQSEQSVTVQTSPQAHHHDKNKEKDREKEKGKKPVKTKFPPSPSVRRKKNDDGGKKGWKGRIIPRSLKKHLMEDSGHDGGSEPEMEDISKLTFGVPLEDCFPSPNNEFVPLIVELCTRIVEARGLDIIGVYRVPGNSVAVAHMQEELNRGIENMNIDSDKWLDVNVVSSLLKAFFRKLPVPLTTEKLYNSFIEANRNPNPEKRMLKLKRLLHTLPEHHYETFKHLAEHLNRVAAHGQSNKMDAKNLAIMFGPTLIRKMEDDTASLVTDMSDQCRIIETIILHNDWFFSPWTQDHYVPIEQINSSHPSAIDTRIPRDDDEDAESAINTKEIISSIVSAANRKLKQRQQNKSTDSLDGESTFNKSINTPPYNERGIDVGDEKTLCLGTNHLSARTKSQISLTSSHSASEECLEQRILAPLATSEPDFLDWEERVRLATPGRHLSQDALLERSDDVEIGGWVGRDTLDWLKRVEQEVRTIRQLEEQRQHEIERRRRQQQFIERELQRSQRDLEMEDAHTVDDILSLSYDSCSANFANTQFQAQPRLSNQTFPEGLLSQNETVGKGRTLASITPQQEDDGIYQCWRGGKYFISVANAQIPYVASHEQASEKVSVHLSHTGSLENVVDTAPVPELQQMGRRFKRSGGFHHGSLDSMLDLLDREDHQETMGSSDSEDGSDLLTSLTTTFDQKLQILLNPKYRLTARHTRIPTTSSSSSGNHGELSRESSSACAQIYEFSSMIEKDRGYREPIFQDPSLHRAAKSDPKIGIASRFEWGTSSPSATVTATGTSGSQQKLANFHSLSHSPQPESNSRIVSKTQLPRHCQYRSDNQVNSNIANRLSTTIDNQSSSSLVCKPYTVTEDNQSNSRTAVAADNCNSRTIIRPNTITADKKISCTEAHNFQEKFEIIKMNGKVANSKPEWNLSKGKEKEKCAPHLGLGSQFESSKSHQSIRLLREARHTLPSQNLVPSTSGQEVRANNLDKQGKKHGPRVRRHTLGGVGDLEHFKTLVFQSSQQPNPQTSAWEQLQPSTKHFYHTSPHLRSLFTWMQNERLRSSTPDLLNMDRHPGHFSS